MNGNKLRNLRENKGLKQIELGHALGISPSTIGMYEQGRREPDNETLKKISNYFAVSTDYLLDNDIEEHTNDKEVREKEILRKNLIRYGYMNDKDNLTDEELSNLMEFVTTNKKFIKEKK